MYILESSTHFDYGNIYGDFYSSPKYSDILTELYNHLIADPLLLLFNRNKLCIHNGDDIIDLYKYIIIEGKPSNDNFDNLPLVLLP